MRSVFPPSRCAIHGLVTLLEQRVLSPVVSNNSAPIWAGLEPTPGAGARRTCFRGTLEAAGELPPTAISCLTMNVLD